MTGKLSERAMLAKLSISAWSGMMRDQEVTDDTNERHKAGKDAGRYNKRLVASSFLKGISSAHSGARTAHRLFTLPWDDDGTRILTTRAYIDYTTKMKECKRAVDIAVKALKGERDNIINEGKTRLGTMFDPDDYPTADEMIAKFGFDIEIKDLPDAGDFRAKLSDDTVKVIIKDIERRTNTRLENAMKDVFLRVKEAVGRMSEKLHGYSPATGDNRAEGIIRDSLVYNIHELAGLLPILNVTNDPRIEELQKQMMDDLVEHSPEILRADSNVRALTIKKADALLKKVNSYLK